MEWTILFVVLWVIANKLEKMEKARFDAEWDRQGKDIDHKIY